MEFCCCENLANVDETPHLSVKRSKCRLCGLKRRPIAALKRDEETEGATAQFIEQSCKSQEKQTVERRKGSTWRVPTTKAHTATRPMRNCGRCGLQKQQMDGAIDAMRLGRIMRGNFGRHTCGNVTRKAKETNDHASDPVTVAKPTTAATLNAVKKSKTKKNNNPSSDKSIWPIYECLSLQEQQRTTVNSSLPTLKSLAHSTISKRPDMIRMHLPKSKISATTLRGEVHCASESVPLQTRVPQGSMTGAIRKRHSYMNFSEHKSKPLLPLNKILCDIVTKHSAKREHFKQETADRLYEAPYKYRAAGGYATPDAYESDALIELPTIDEKTGIALHANSKSHKDSNILEPECLSTVEAAFYNSNVSAQQQRFGDVTSLVSPKWLPCDFTRTTTHGNSKLGTDASTLDSVNYFKTKTCSDVVDAQPIFSVRSLVADQFGNNFQLCNKKLDIGQNSDRATAEVVSETRINVAAETSNIDRRDDNETQKAGTQNSKRLVMLGGQRRNETAEHTKFRGPLGFRKAHEAHAHGNQAQFFQALQKSRQPKKPLNKCVQKTVQRQNMRGKKPNEDGRALEITIQKRQVKKQPKREKETQFDLMLRKALMGKENRLPLVENNSSKQTIPQQTNPTITKRKSTKPFGGVIIKSFAPNTSKARVPIVNRVENHALLTRTTANGSRKSYRSQTRRRQPANNLPQNRRNITTPGTKNALVNKSNLETVPKTITKSRDLANNLCAASMPSMSKAALCQPDEKMHKLAMPASLTQIKNLSPRMKRLIGIQASHSLERCTSKPQKQILESKSGSRLASRMQPTVEQLHKQRFTRATSNLLENQLNNRKISNRKQSLSREERTPSFLELNNTKLNSLNKIQKVFPPIKKPSNIKRVDKVSKELGSRQTNLTEHVTRSYQNTSSKPEKLKFPSKENIPTMQGISKPQGDDIQSSINQVPSKLSLRPQESKVSTKNYYEAKQTTFHKSPPTTSERRTVSPLPSSNFFVSANDECAESMTSNSKEKHLRKKTAIVRKIMTRRSTDSSRSRFSSGMSTKPIKRKYKHCDKKDSPRKLNSNDQLCKNLSKKKLTKKEKKLTAGKADKIKVYEEKIKMFKPASIKNNKNEKVKTTGTELDRSYFVSSTVVHSIISQEFTRALAPIQTNDLLEICSEVPHKQTDVTSCSDSFRTLTYSTERLSEPTALKENRKTPPKASEILNPIVLNSNKDRLEPPKETKGPLTPQTSHQSLKIQQPAANVQPTQNQYKLGSSSKTKEFIAHEDELIAQFISEDKLFKNDAVGKRCTICKPNDSLLSAISQKSMPTGKVKSSARRSKNKTAYNKKEYTKQFKMKYLKVYKKPPSLWKSKRAKSCHDVSTENTQNEEKRVSCASLPTNNKTSLGLPLLKQPRPYYFEFRMPDVEPSNVVTYTARSAHSLKSELPDADWFNYYESYISKDPSLKGIHSDCDCESNQDSQKSDCSAFSMDEYLPIPCCVHNCNALLTPSGLLAHFAHEHCHWYGAYAKVQCQSICNGTARHMALNVNNLALGQIQYVGILAYGGGRGEKSLVERNFCSTSVLLPAFMQELAQTLPVVILACKLPNSVLHEHTNKATMCQLNCESSKNHIVAIWAVAYSIPLALQLKMTVYDKQFLCSRKQVICARYFHKSSQDPYEFVASKKDYLLLSYDDLKLLTQDFKTDLRLDVVISELQKT